MGIYESLMEIVGNDRVSNAQEERYFYSRDSGAQPPRRADYVILPKTTEEVQEIVRLANREKIPITPMGGGFTLSALAVPNRAGIVLDMKGMDRMGPNTLRLITRVKGLLDPAGIMNPGNWDPGEGR